MMTIKLFDLSGADDLRFSPNCWRIRMALAHKELEAEFEPWNFTNKETLKLYGSETVPVIIDSETTMNNSWSIANYLEDHYSQASSLFGGDAGRAVTGFINAWADLTLHPTLIRCILPDIYERLHSADKDYFRTSREKRFNMTIEEMRSNQTQSLAALDHTMTPLRKILKTEDWMAGDTPAYADYIIFGAFQWARLTSPVKIIKADDPIYSWRERMLDLFDSLGRSFKAATQEFTSNR